MVRSKKEEVRRHKGIGAMRTLWVAVAALLCSGAVLASPLDMAPDVALDVPRDVPRDVPPDVALDVPLVDAVRRGDAAAVRALLDGGADVD